MIKMFIMNKYIFYRSEEDLVAEDVHMGRQSGQYCLKKIHIF